MKVCWATLVRELSWIWNSINSRVELPVDRESFSKRRISQDDPVLSSFLLPVSWRWYSPNLKKIILQRNVPIGLWKEEGQYLSHGFSLNLAQLSQAPASFFFKKVPTVETIRLNCPDNTNIHEGILIFQLLRITSSCLKPTLYSKTLFIWTRTI